MISQATYGVYKGKLDTKDRLLAEIKIIEEERKALLKQIEAEQGNVSQYYERQAALNSEMAGLELKLVESQDLLVRREQERIEATNEKRELEQETVVIKKDITDIELCIQKLEQEKTSRDHTIKCLNDETANQDENY